MYELKDPLLVKYSLNQLFKCQTVATKSTFQTPYSQPFLMKGKKAMQDEPLQLQLQHLQQDTATLKHIVSLLQLQLQHLQKETVTNKNQWEYCSSHLSKLDIPTDEQSLEEHQNYSCGNHYDC